jgi:hypothetical protein
MNHDDDMPMTPEAAAKYLGVSKSTLAKWRCYGTGPEYYKIGQVTYLKKDLDAYRAKFRFKSTAQAQLKKRLTTSF